MSTIRVLILLTCLLSSIANVEALAMATKRILVRGAGEAAVNGVFTARSPKVVPAGFTRTCNEMGWPSDEMWVKLSDSTRVWYEHENESYIYWNRSDGRWWIDVPSGAGAYIVASSEGDPPSAGWRALPGMKSPVPSISVEEAASSS